MELKHRLDPRGVLLLAERLRDANSEGVTIAVAPYLSAATRERLGEASLGFLDLTGNVRLEIREPGLFIESQGASVDPDRRRNPSRSLRGGKAGRIVRVLVDLKEAPGVRELAGLAEISPGYVSRVLALLDREALIERRGRGRIVKVDWPRLLRRWAEDAPLDSRGTTAMCLEPRGLSVLKERLKGVKLHYAITGSLAAERHAPFAPPRLAVLYCRNLGSITEQLGLREVDAGANVMLIEPVDDGVFVGASEYEGLVFAAVSQVAADLLTSPGRGPAEGEELISWMEAREEVWRA